MASKDLTLWNKLLIWDVNNVPRTLTVLTVFASPTLYISKFWIFKMQNTLFTFFNTHSNGKPYFRCFTNISYLYFITQWGKYYYYIPFTETEAQWNNSVDNIISICKLRRMAWFSVQHICLLYLLSTCQASCEMLIHWKLITV